MRAIAAFNPVQYLGSKARLLAPIVAARRRLARGGASVDLFSGSSVVSQALAAAAPVVAVDASPASAALFEGTMRRAPLAALPPPARPHAEERRLVRAADVDGLVRMYRAMRPGAWSAERWVESYYGGHFFGVTQARELDRLRGGVHTAALLGAASRLAASAGKHFASPLNFLGPREPTPFVKRRLLEDRRRDARATFLQVLAEIGATPPPRHAAASRFARHDLARGLPAIPEEVGFAYADPPYTTEQYSRYYHVLDALAADAPFEITPTLGRYPAWRHRSDFSSPARAPGAFARLFDAVRALDAPFALSYSAPRREGARSRTVELAQLVDLLAARYRDVGTIEIDHKYRPLQPAARMRPSASEVLVVARP